jgi:hypothetical protein
VGVPGARADAAAAAREVVERDGSHPNRQLRENDAADDGDGEERRLV